MLRRKPNLSGPLFALAALALALFAPCGVAQGQLIDRSRIAESTPGVRTLGQGMSLEPGAGEESVGLPVTPGAGADFGESRVVSVLAEWEPWQVGGDLGAFYTDNAALTSFAPQSDWYFRETLRASYTPKLIGNLFGFGQLSYSEYQYDKFDVLDFGMTDLSLGLVYIARPLWDTTFMARYRYYRITDGLSLGDQLFDNHAFVLSAQNAYSFARGQNLVGGLEAQLSFSSDRAEVARHEFSLIAGYIGEWTGWLETGLLYRLSYYDYWRFGREDWVQNVDLSVSWKPTDYLALTATVGFGTSDSNYSFFDYDAWNTGVVLSATLTF